MHKALLIVVLALSACQLWSGPDEDPGDDVPSGDDDPDCHYDCFGDSQCVDGVVTVWASEPVPCEYWEGECRIEETLECQRGCRTDVAQLGPSDDPSLLCEEMRPKHAGDACAAEPDCRPEADGEYLACDVDAGECVARPPPTIADLYASCGLHVDSPELTTFPSGVLATDLCTAGVCAWTRDQAASCIEQLCTAECENNGECPPGTTCEELYYTSRVCLPTDWAAAPIECLP